MISLDSEPSGNDIERRQDNCASQRDDDEYSQSDHNVFVESLERLGKLREEEVSDGPEPESYVCNMQDLHRKKAGR